MRDGLLYRADGQINFDMINKSIAAIETQVIDHRLMQFLVKLLGRDVEPFESFKEAIQSLNQTPITPPFIQNDFSKTDRSAFNLEQSSLDSYYDLKIEDDIPNIQGINAGDLMIKNMIFSKKDINILSANQNYTQTRTNQNLKVPLLAIQNSKQTNKIEKKLFSSGSNSNGINSYENPFKMQYNFKQSSKNTEKIFDTIKTNSSRQIINDSNYLLNIEQEHKNRTNNSIPISAIEKIELAIENTLAISKNKRQIIELNLKQDTVHGQDIPRGLGWDMDNY